MKEDDFVMKPGETLLSRDGDVFVILTGNEISVRFIGIGVWWNWILTAAMAAHYSLVYKQAFQQIHNTLYGEVCPECGERGGHKDGCPEHEKEKAMLEDQAS